MHKNKSGFTIVELLIVIVIIGILAAITIVAYNGIQQRARYASYVSDIQSINKAIMLYQVDNSAYPITGGCVVWSAASTSVIPGLTPTYIKTIPGPSYTGDGTYYAYCNSAGGADYKLIRLVPGGQSVPTLEQSGSPFAMDPNRTPRGWGAWSAGGSAL